MHIVVADINEEKGKKTADSLQGIFVKVDVSDGVNFFFLFYYLQL